MGNARMQTNSLRIETVSAIIQKRKIDQLALDSFIPGGGVLATLQSQSAAEERTGWERNAAEVKSWAILPHL